MTTDEHSFYSSRGRDACLFDNIVAMDSYLSDSEIYNAEKAYVARCSRLPRLVLPLMPAVYLLNPSDADICMCMLLYFHVRVIVPMSGWLPGISQSAIGIHSI
jgi:hypothetical protein